MPIAIITAPIAREVLKKHLLNNDLVKAVVDIKLHVMAVGGAMHADEEQVLLDRGSAQEDLWGINLYPDDFSDAFIEFDSMINIRPRQNNRSRSVEDPAIRAEILAVVTSLISS